jgi:hypothetical protein
MTTSAKTIRIEVVISGADWDRYRAHYTEKDIRSAIADGGLEELERLVQNREEYPSVGEGKDAS